MTNVYHFSPRSRNRLGRHLNRQSGSGNIRRLRQAQTCDGAQAYEDLTAQLVMRHQRAGTLDPKVMEYFLLGLGYRL